MAIILRLLLCLHKLKRMVICVDNHLLPQNIMLPLSVGLNNRLHILIIGGVPTDNIKECLTAIGHHVPLLSEDCTNNII